jgi:hypothetical protein
MDIVNLARNLHLQHFAAHQRGTVGDAMADGVVAPARTGKMRTARRGGSWTLEGIEAGRALIVFCARM